jgi:glycosyltransferase involved in cell wall biosynthesis
MKQPRKIMMLTTGHSPFDDRIYFKETLSLAKKYARIILVAPGGKAEYSIKEPGIEYVPLPKAGSLMARTLLIFRAAFAVIRIRPDVCHFHDFELIFALPLIRLFSGCKIIYDVHEFYPESVLESDKVPLSCRPFFAGAVDVSEKCLARLAHYIITTDDSIRQRLQKVHGSVKTVFNYPRLSLFTPDPEKIAGLEAAYRDRTPIMYVGSMSETKGGLFLMLKAMEIVKHQLPDVILLLVGWVEEDTLQRMMTVIEERRLQDCVKYVGSVPHEEVVNYISVARLGLIANLPTPKWQKNIPIKQFEYMACGVPILGSDLPPIASYVKAAGCGMVFDPTSAGALAAAVADMLKDRDEWNRMSEAGRKAVRDLWNWEKMEAELFSVYEEVLA